ncbi:hypothetical protein HDV06_001849 [Boothiomyces sp. JEL0866]|nr:hypothetical protein HDV06_001849 [Boothiomyces sp. JEL0866]
MKNDFRKYYTEGKSIALDPFINRIFDNYAYYDFTRIFKKCGYETSGQFNPGCAEILCDDFFAEDDDQPVQDVSINRENETPELTTVQIALDNEAQSA